MAAPRLSLPPRYAVQQLVAHGGMGDVYRASDERLGRVVAVKVLAERYARQDEFRQRFLREARTAATLTGEPNVVAIYDVGETTDGLPFIVMEYVSEGTVADRLASGAVPTDTAMRWLAQAASALDAAHARGVVHRDVKPANLLVSSEDAVRVSDFGIARAAGDDTLTAAGTVLGSSGYMAPEQARGEPSTPATDRYALACVAFELLTGRRPFARDTPAAEAAAHAYESPPPVGDVASLPESLDGVFARGLAKRPSDRPPTCAALVTELRDALAGGGTRTVPLAAPTRATEPRIVRHRSGRSRTALLGAALALLVAGVGVAWGLTSLDDGSGTATVVVTETTRGETVERTVTESDTVVVTESGDEPAAEDDAVPAGESGAELNDRGFRLLQQGDAQGALPLLEEAVSRLGGSSSLAEAYASYNLALARFTLGRCDGVAELLDRSADVQGKRKEIDRLRKQVDRRCDEDEG